MSPTALFTQLYMAVHPLAGLAVLYGGVPGVGMDGWAREGYTGTREGYTGTHPVPVPGEVIYSYLRLGPYLRPNEGYF